MVPISTDVDMLADKVADRVADRVAVVGNAMDPDTARRATAGPLRRVRLCYGP